jgi:F-type H+-transporting ATPase subunit alpha
VSDNIQEIGYASAINDYLISVNGLPNAAINEIVTTRDNARGLITTLREDTVDVLMLDDGRIKPREAFMRTRQQFAIRAGNYLLGRTISPLGQPIDGKGKLPTTGTLVSVDQPIRGIKTRQTINQQFETGITTVDMLVPIARGQRELLMGGTRAGKTSFLIDMIVNQRGKGIICIFAMIGKPIREMRQIVDILTINKALEYTVIVGTSSSELASLIFLTPAVAITLAEFFQKQGRDVLLVLDDLGTHAKFYREISLLSSRSPGRESYPGDIFYQHARILERGGNFNKENGGSSITVLPVIETNLDGYTAFIPTNLMSMTDGHLLYDSSLYKQGVRPAIDIPLSVTRVGRQTQTLPQKMLADKVRTALAESAKLENLSRFGSEISSQTQLLLKQAKQIKAILTQGQLVKLPVEVQMVMLALTFSPFLQSKEADFVIRFKQTMISYLSSAQVLPQLEKKIQNFKSDLELIEFVKGLTPEMERICQVPAK